MFKLDQSNTTEGVAGVECMKSEFLYELLIAKMHLG